MLRARQQSVTLHSKLTMPLPQVTLDERRFVLDLQKAAEEAIDTTPSGPFACLSHSAVMREAKFAAAIRRYDWASAERLADSTEVHATRRSLMKCSLSKSRLKSPDGVCLRSSYPSHGVLISALTPTRCYRSLTTSQRHEQEWPGCSTTSRPGTGARLLSRRSTRPNVRISEQ